MGSLKMKTIKFLKIYLKNSKILKIRILIKRWRLSSFVCYILHWFYLLKSILSVIYCIVLGPWCDLLNLSQSKIFSDQNDLNFCIFQRFILKNIRSEITISVLDVFKGYNGTFFPTCSSVKQIDLILLLHLKPQKRIILT